MWPSQFLCRLRIISISDLFSSTSLSIFSLLLCSLQLIFSILRRIHSSKASNVKCKCNVKLRKFLSAYKSHVRRASLFTGAIPNPVRNCQTSRFVSVPGQNPERSSRGDSVVLRLQSVMMADVWWCRSGTGIGYRRVTIIFSNLHFGGKTRLELICSTNFGVSLLY